MSPCRAVVLFPLVLAAAIAAQDPGSNPMRVRPGDAPVGTLGDGLRGDASGLDLDDPRLWRVPIHTHEPDPVAGEYGWWAAGRGFKASFHDGFELVPYLGESAPTNLPWRWTTVGITAGGEPIVDRITPIHRHDLWRYEYDFGAFVEAYDVRLEGVEQSFVVRTPPRSGGDLVVRGRIDSPLTCDDVAQAHQALTYCNDAGEAIVRYGEAFAIDAIGRRTTVATAVAGDTVSLTVPGAWLADAIYPVTIDPLTAPVPVLSGGNRIGATHDLAHDSESHEIMIAFARAASATDLDSFAILVTNDFVGQVTVYSDLATSYSVNSVQCCFVGGADKWAVAVGREHTSGARNLAVYVHPRAFYTPNAGFTKSVGQNSPSITFDKYPTIGGSFHPTIGTKAMLVWEREFNPTNTSLTIVVGAVVDVTTNASIPASSQFGICPLTGDRERPCVNKSSSTGDWIVAYQFANTQAPTWDWDIRVGVVSSAGAVYSDFPIAADNGSTHELAPRIDGSEGRYFVCAAMANNTGPYSDATGDRIVALSFDWTGSLVRLEPWRVVDSAVGNALTFPLRARCLSYDRATVSHAILSYYRTNLPTTATFARIGLHGIPVETITRSNVGSVCLDFNQDYLTHDATWLVPPGSTTMNACHVEYPSAACTVYGTSCGPTISCTNANLPANLAAPYRGSTQFALWVGNAGYASSCIPVLGFATGSLTLPGGCPLLVSAANLIALPTMTANRLGNVKLDMPIPETIGVGHLYSQWVVLTTGGSLRTSNALDLDIR